ncbi:GNAT family N-acetyltransferase [Natronomonas marina]|jgi:predicted GNAT family N-acyltransferase|uniref:GNAT family N-acetyltransferase n=1 Tax=Natronomonas marina TaxID=2961939 RepID=UPI0020CA1F52|nr:GNAT family N-acetyltransferase [Natronomonas marina]
MDVRRVETDDELTDALAVRREVFVDEQDVPEHRELDGRDDAATHFVAYDGDRPVGAARLRAYDDATAKVERVAVLASERGRGLGRELMDAVETQAIGDGYEAVVLHAQVPVVEFYERLGYEVTSEPFEDAGIPHREMRKDL